MSVDSFCPIYEHGKSIYTIGKLILDSAVVYQ